MRGKEGCVQLVEPHQDATEWKRDDFSGWKSKYACGRKEIGCCEGPGVDLVKREPTKSSTIARRRVEWWKCQSPSWWSHA